MPQTPQVGSTFTGASPARSARPTAPIGGLAAAAFGIARAIGSSTALSRAAGLVLSGLMVAFSASSALAQPPSAEQRGKPFWTALAKDCAVPAGETAFGLVSEAVSLPRPPRQLVARRRRLRRRGELCLPEEAADAGGATRARRPALGQPAPRHRRERHRLRPAPVLLGPRPLDPGRARERRSRARRRRLPAAPRRRPRLPARRARPARPRAAGRLDPRDGPHRRPAEVPGPRPALHARRPGAAAGRQPGRR